MQNSSAQYRNSGRLFIVAFLTVCTTHAIPPLAHTAATQRLQSLFKQLSYHPMQRRHQEELVKIVQSSSRTLPPAMLNQSIDVLATPVDGRFTYPLIPANRDTIVFAQTHFANIPGIHSVMQRIIASCAHYNFLKGNLFELHAAKEYVTSGQGCIGGFNQPLICRHSGPLLCADLLICNDQGQLVEVGECKNLNWPLYKLKGQPHSAITERLVRQLTRLETHTTTYNQQRLYNKKPQVTPMLISHHPLTEEWREWLELRGISYQVSMQKLKEEAQSKEPS